MSEKQRANGHMNAHIKQPPFDEGAAVCMTQLIAIEHGAVQFRARRLFAINDDVVTLPFPVLFNLMGTLLQVLAADSEAGNALRAHIGSAVAVTRKMPALPEDHVQ